MRINADSFVGVGICILGLVGVGYAIGVHSKMKVMCDRLDTSIDNLANNTEIDIPAKVIDQAVQKAVERESYSAVKRATEEVVADAKREIELEDIPRAGRLMYLTAVLALVVFGVGKALLIVL